MKLLFIPFIHPVGLPQAVPFLFIYSSVRREFSAYPIYWEDQWIEVCKVDTAGWVRDVVGENLYFTTYFVFRVIFVHLVPCVCLVALNCLLFRAMKQAQERRDNLFRENRKKECKKLRDSNCTTLMLIVVVTVFLVVEIPLAVLTLLHIISSVVIQFLDYHLVSICILFANFALIVSYPINFAIYCGMSRQFRETFKELFLRGGSGSIKSLQSKGAASSRYSLVNGPRTCTNETVL